MFQGGTLDYVMGAPFQRTVVFIPSMVYHWDLMATTFTMAQKLTAKQGTNTPR